MESSGFPSSSPTVLHPIKALFFDQIGTTVSWHPSIQRTLQSHASRSPSLCSRQPPVDWAKFGHEWRTVFFEVNASQIHPSPSTSIWDLYGQALDTVCERNSIGEDVWNKEEKVEILKGWWNLEAWPDTQAGLELLKTRYSVVAFANGSVTHLIHVFKQVGISYDLLLTSDILGAWKPSPQAYQRVAELMQLKPEECAMVASHAYDLEAAAKIGMRTIYTARSTEDLSVHVNSDTFDLFIGEGGLLELARRLGLDV